MIIKNAEMNKANGKSMDETALVLMKKNKYWYPNHDNYRSL